MTRWRTDQRVGWGIAAALSLIPVAAHAEERGYIDTHMHLQAQRPGGANSGTGHAGRGGPGRGKAAMKNGNQEAAEDLVSQMDQYGVEKAIIMPPPQTMEKEGRYGVPIDLHMEAVPETMTTPQNLRDACSKNPARLPETVPALERLLALHLKPP